MMKKVKVLMNEFVTHNVRRIVVEKPKGYEYVPGQAAELAIDKPGWKKETRPFTLTGLMGDLVLEFMIKIYSPGESDHKGVTEKIRQLEPGEELWLSPAFGQIRYQGPGVFIAGGAGVTPFVAILRNLWKEGKIDANWLLFSNKTQRDVILEKELKEIFRHSGGDLLLTLTQDDEIGYEYGRIDEEFLERFVVDWGQMFYVCGPREMVAEIKGILEGKGVKPEAIVVEK